MNRYRSYPDTACLLLEQYNGTEPFASFIKKFFSQNKKYGSRDRKQIAHLCYCFFRLGRSANNLDLKEKILTALFLCSNEPNEVLAALKPEWNEATNFSLKNKLSAFGITLSVADVFPWKDELSEGMDHEKFCESFFTQPDLFIRVRPGYERAVQEKLNAEDLMLKVWNEQCIQLPNATKIEALVEIDKEAVIQDYSSQQTGEIIKSEIINPKSAFLKASAGKSERNLWDCCAGSGGKSIMMHDILPRLELTVSDVRESILLNLKKRFAKAGIKNYKTALVDLSNTNHPLAIINNQFSIILADVPCTGSGTWGRTPEQLYFFNHQKIKQFSHLQKNIVTNVILHLQPGGYLVYITCSVFKKENEEVVNFIRENSGLQLKRMQVLKGYDKKADSMFIAVMRR